MKTISVFIVAGFIFFANLFATTSAGGQCFKVFLVDRKLGDTTSIDCEAALKTTPLLTNDDLDSCSIAISEKNADRYKVVLYLKEMPSVKLLDNSEGGPIALHGLSFVITISGHFLCEGSFWSLFSELKPPFKNLIYLPNRSCKEAMILTFSTEPDSSSILHSELLRCLAGSR